MNEISSGSVLISLLFWISLGGIFYTYFGYPVLMYVIAKMIQKPEFHQTNKPSVTLLIAAYNEERDLAAKLENTLALDYPKSHLEVIVTSDCSQNGTDDIVGLRQHVTRMDTTHASLAVAIRFVPVRRCTFAGRRG